MGLASTTKYLRQIAGQLAETFAITTSAGGADANAIPALNANGFLDPTIVNAKVISAGAGDAGRVAALDGSGRLDVSVMPVGLGADVASATAFETLAAGDFVNLYNNAGVSTVRKADATNNGKPANGFVLAAVNAGNAAQVYLAGQNTAVTGQTVGEVFLQTTAGKAGAAAPSASGNAVQSIGLAVSATSIEFKPQRSITLA